MHHAGPESHICSWLGLLGYCLLLLTKLEDTVLSKSGARVDERCDEFLQSSETPASAFLPSQTPPVPALTQLAASARTTAQPFHTTTKQLQDTQ
jgi:hypothetical protein